MVSSDWDDWFLKHELELVEPDGLSIWFIGCNGFVLRSPEATIFIDPYFGGSVPPRLLRMAPVPFHPNDVSHCDAIFVTHEHLDHMHPPSYMPIVKNTGAHVYAPEAAWDEVSESHDSTELNGGDHVINPGDSYEIGDLSVHVRPGSDPDAIEEVTFVVQHESGTFFHGGDSRVCESFDEVGSEFDIDLGVLAMGSEGRQYYPDRDELVDRRKVYMDYDEVVEVANSLKLERVAPSHYRMWKGVGANPSVLKHHSSSFEYPRIIEEIEVGDRLEIDSPGVVPPRVLDRAQSHR